MKKKLFQRLSGFLAAVLLISLFPITVSAVNKIVLSDGSAVPAAVLAGQTYALKVSDNTKVNFYSSNESVAKIGKTTGVLEPIAPGKVTVTAKDAKTDAVVAKFTFTVLQRAVAVNAGAETLYLSQGDRYTLKPVLTPANSTDVLRFVSDDKSIATVGQTSGEVTAKALGETTITIYAKEKATTSNTDPENCTATVRVVVQEKPLKADVLNGNRIKLTFSADIPDGVTAKNFSVTQANTMGVSKTLGIENVAQNSSRELLLTMAEPVFSETETSTVTLYFTSPDDENHIIVVNLGKKYADTSELKSVTSSGKTNIEAGTGGFLQFFGVDKDGASYPLDSVTLKLYSYVTNSWTVLTETTALDKVVFSQKLLSDGSLMVTYTALPDAAAGTRFAIQLEKENGSSFPASSLLINSAGQNAKYSLRFVSPEGEELFEPLTLSAGTFFTPPTPAREGYTFKEWKRSDGEEDVIPERVEMPEYDLTLTAVFEYNPSELMASVSADGWTYGSPVSPSLINSPADASIVTYQYKAVGSDDTEWSEMIPAAVGNYQVRAVISDAEGKMITTAAVYFTVRPKEVAIIGTTVAPSKVYDGNNIAKITDSGTLDGVVDGDDVIIVPGTAAYNDETVGAGKTVTFTNFALGGADKDNYVLAAQPASVTADITDPNAGVISVDISWDSMEFTYTAPSKGTWNPETHEYENATDGGWTSQGGNITVINNGNVGIAAKFSYMPAAGMSEIGGLFTASSLTIDAGKADSTTLTLSGAPSAEFERGTLGTVNVSINKYGWLSQNGKTYYYDSTGQMVTGWQTDIPGWDGKWFYFDTDGTMATGLRSDIPGGEGKCLYFGTDGAMRTGWVDDIPGWEGQWFYFDDTGAMCTGWQTDVPGWDNKWFYFDDTGVMHTGWVEIDGKWYYFDETGQLVKSSAEAPNE